jgi:hypothetical protein
MINNWNEKRLAHILIFTLVTISLIYLIVIICIKHAKLPCYNSLAFILYHENSGTSLNTNICVMYAFNFI